MVAMASIGCRCLPLLIFAVTAFICMILSSASSEFLPAANDTQSPTSDVKNLLLFRDSIVQDSRAISAFSSWNASTVTPCRWSGVTCNPFTDSVVSLSLPGLGLRGAITSGLGQITTLLSLDLSGNRFSGSLPANLSSSLKSLNLSDNSFSGPVPANLFRPGELDLQVFDLASNNLSGNFPQDILLRSPRLTHLDVSRNQLYGSFSSLHFSPSLRSLNLFRNNFTGALPSDIGNKLVNLVVLNVGANRLQGQIPSSIGSLTSLQILVLEKNGLTEGIPESIGKMMNLVQLGLGENWINGTLPASLSNCSNLQLLLLQNNNLTGGIPAGWQSLKKLSTLNLQNNQLGGPIPSELGNCSALTSLNVAANNFGGGIPAEIGNLSNLQELIMHANNLQGLIPSSISALSELRILSISNNRLTGGIPGGIAYLQQLQLFHASGNGLQGQIPQQLGVHSGIREIDLSFNELLNGSIPAGLCSGGSLHVLNLTGNNLTQGLGAFLNRSLQCGSLLRVGLGLNSLGGELPGPSISLLANATVLDLSHNRFSGPIPPDLGSLSKLEVLDLSSNQLSGTVPSELAGMASLKSVNISMNLLTGVLPSSPAFSGSPVSSYSGNSGLCGTPLVECLRFEDRLKFASSSPAPSPLDDAQPVSDTIQKALPLLIAAAVVGILISMLLLHLIARSVNGNKVQPVASRPAGASPFTRSKKSSPRVSPYEEVESPVGHKAFKVENLEARALEAAELSFSCSMENPYSASLDDVVEQLFNKDNEITRNKYSTIYRVATAESENKYVIKKLKLPQNVLEAHEEEITMELESLQKFSHKHVMRPIHFFIHNGRMLLMYKDCFPHGTLRQLLDTPLQASPRPVTPRRTTISPSTQDWAENIYSSVSGDQSPMIMRTDSYLDFSTDGNGLLLDWDRRSKIALGLALGIQELHQCERPVVHLDISSNNILIDEEFQPQIGDMELSNILDPTKVHSEYITSLPGSTGYIAPEYAYTSRVTRYSNVYTYGVVLLELLTGRKPTDRAYGEGYDLVKWVKLVVNSHQDLLQGVLDPQLQLHHAGMHNVRQHMLYVLSVALLCLEVLPSQRPQMTLVVEMLRNYSK